MNVSKLFFNWFGRKFDAWLQRVGEENHPIENDYDAPFDDELMFRHSDLMPDERGDFDNRF